MAYYDITMVPLDALLNVYNELIDIAELAGAIIHPTNLGDLEKIFRELELIGSITIPLADV